LKHTVVCFVFFSPLKPGPFVCESNWNTVVGGSLYCLYHHSLIWIIIHHMYLLCTSSTALYCMYNNLHLFIFYTYL